jgi:small-conductance mechanosensitive channel
VLGKHIRHGGVICPPHPTSGHDKYMQDKFLYTVNGYRLIIIIGREINCFCDFLGSFCRFQSIHSQIGCVLTETYKNFLKYLEKHSGDEQTIDCFCDCVYEISILVIFSSLNFLFFYYNQLMHRYFIKVHIITVFCILRVSTLSCLHQGVTTNALLRNIHSCNCNC